MKSFRDFFRRGIGDNGPAPDPSRRPKAPPRPPTPTDKDIPWPRTSAPTGCPSLYAPIISEEAKAIRELAAVVEGLKKYGVQLEAMAANVEAIKKSLATFESCISEGGFSDRRKPAVRTSTERYQ